jgi:hypothetical protein
MMVLMGGKAVVKKRQEAFCRETYINEGRETKVWDVRISDPEGAGAALLRSGSGDGPPQDDLFNNSRPLDPSE